MTKSDFDEAEDRLRREIIHSGNRALLTPTNGLVALCIALVGFIFYSGEQFGLITQNQTNIAQETEDRKEADREIRKDYIRAIDSLNLTFDVRMREWIELIREGQRINAQRGTGK